MYLWDLQQEAGSFPVSIPSYANGDIQPLKCRTTRLIRKATWSLSDPFRSANGDLFKDPGVKIHWSEGSSFPIASVVANIRLPLSLKVILGKF